MILSVRMPGCGGRTRCCGAENAVQTEPGRTVVTADLTVLARRTGFPVTSVPRDRLIEHLARGVEVEFDREIAGVEVRPDGVTAIDAAGGRHEADVVVGADGHRSAVRRAVLDPAPVVPTGWTTWQGLSPVLPELDGRHDRRLRRGPGRAGRAAADGRGASHVVVRRARAPA